MNEAFRRFATRASHWVGSARVFVVALLLVLVWLVSGPYYDYSASWQLVINTGTTIVTFLMVFLIQNAQNRHAHARPRRAAGRGAVASTRGIQSDARSGRAVSSIEHATLPEYRARPPRRRATGPTVRLD